MEPSEELRMFFLQRLRNHGFTEDMVEIVSKEYQNVEKRQEKQIGLELIATANKLIDNPGFLQKLLRRRDIAKYIFDWTIAALVISALLLLAHWAVIDKTQVGTILGGIVGYLLGNTSKN